MLALCKALHPKYNIAALTNDIFTQEVLVSHNTKMTLQDREFLVKNDALPHDRIRAVETGMILKM